MDDKHFADPRSAELVLDMQWNPEGYWTTMPGYASVGTFGTTNEIDAVHFFTQHNGRRVFMLYERRTAAFTANLSFLYWPAGTETVIASGRRRSPTGGFGTQFFDFGGWVYYIDGINAPTAWNGDHESPVGFSGPAAPPQVAGFNEGWSAKDVSGAVYNAAAPKVDAFHPQQRGLGEFPVGFAASGTNPNNSTVTPWKYGYALTEINERGHESPPSPIVFATGENELATPPTTDANAVGRRLAKVLKPEAADHIRGGRLWRTRNIVDVAAGTSFTLFLHSTFDTGARIDFIDHLPDEDLSLEVLDPDEFGPFPATARHMTFWKGHMWAAGMADEPERARYSNGLLVEQFPANNHVQLGVADAGAVTGFKATPQALLVFRERAVIAIRGDAINGFAPEVVSSKKGAAGPQGIVEIPGAGTGFMDPSGPQIVLGAFEFEGKISRVVPLGESARIQRTWNRRVSRQNLHLARAVVDTESHEVWWQVCEGGDVRQKLGLAFNYATQQWSRRDGWPIGAFAYHAGRVWFGSWDGTNHPGIFVLTHGAVDKDGDTLTSQWDTAVLRLPQRGSFHQIRVWGMGDNNAVTVSHRADHNDAWTQISDTAREVKQRHEEARPVWSTATWSLTELFSDHEPARVPISYRGNGLDHQLRFVGKMSLFGFDIGFDPGKGPTKIPVPEATP